MRLKTIILICLLTVPMPAFAQMTSQQREFDFMSLMSIYAKRYGPANWKYDALGIDIFEGRPWMERVRASRNDVEYWQICAEFVAALQDGHSSYRSPASFTIDSGLAADIYDGKVLVEAINRMRYPLAAYPIAIGDEIVSIGGRPVNELIGELVKSRGFGNPRGVRRLAADAMVFRSQTLYPNIANAPDESDFMFRKPDGSEYTLTLTWLKRGRPATAVGPVPSPRFSAKPRAAVTPDDVIKPLLELKTWEIPSSDLALTERTFTGEEGQETTRSFISGFGLRNPYYTLPTGFNVRLGRLSSDVFVSGTYVADGLRIGYLRIPNFAANPSVALPQLDAEVAFMRANTDGMVVDVTRNTGGGCIGLDYAARLIPQRFWFFGEHYRPTLATLNNYIALLEIAKLLALDQWVLDTYQQLIDEFTLALSENRAMTGPLPACTTTAARDLPTLYRPATFDNEPEPGAYDKPMIFLADEFSVSFGDIFPAMMQDNRRGPIVGMRTGGLGGSVSVWPAGMYSEGLTSNTNSLVTRRSPVTVPGLPTAALIENIGVVPDIVLDYMTRDNLIQNGRPFVDAFTRIMVDHIRQPRP